MRWRESAALLVLICLPSLSMGLELSSIHPDTAFTGQSVTVIGDLFTPSIRVVIGGREITPSLVDERQLIFVVPQLDAGEHALYLRSNQRKSERTISLRVSLPPPQVHSLEPSNIDECSTQEQRSIVLRGDHFREGSQVLLGNNIVPSSRLSETEITFTVPPLKAGTHGVQVINSDGSSSLRHPIWLNNIPHIYDVSRGEDYLSYYQLIITGRNFAHNSTLIVNEYPAGLANIQRQEIIPEQGGPEFQGEYARKQFSDAIIYIDCNTLIYNRYPISGQDKTLSLRVANPDGKQTERYELSAP